MNYLAHTLLSKKDIDYQTANLLCDHIKGKTWNGCSQSHVDGMAMHRAIDRFTDEHPDVRKAKARLGSGYLKGVVTDILFDHFLSRHWQRFVSISLNAFSEQFYHDAMQYHQRLSPQGIEFIERVIKYDFFHLYYSQQSLHKVYQKFDLRLSERLLRKERAVDYLPLIEQHYTTLESDFLRFFPKLIQFFIKKSQATSNEHYFLDQTKPHTSTGGVNNSSRWIFWEFAVIIGITPHLERIM